MELKDRVAVITGASRGIGRAIALEMAKEGANLCIVYKSQDEHAKEVERQIKVIGREVLCIKADIAVQCQTEKFAEQVYEKFNCIDILINNAGIVKDFSFAGMEQQEWQEVIDTNLTGTFNMCKSVSRYMIMQKNGTLITPA